MKAKRIIFYGANVVVSILVGVVIYIASDSDTLFTRFLYPYISIPFIEIPKQVRNYLPDFLWAYSLTFTIMFIFHYSLIGFIATFLISISFAMIIEVSQLCNLVAGTFDILDVVFEIISIVLALFIIYLFEGDKNEKNS